MQKCKHGIIKVVKRVEIYPVPLIHLKGLNAENKILPSPLIRGMFEMNCLLSSSLISTWGMIKTNTYLYRVIQYLHNGV